VKLPSGLRPSVRFNSICLGSYLSQFSSDYRLPGLVLLVYSVQFDLPTSDAAPYQFRRELLLPVTNPGRPHTFTSPSRLQLPLRLGATSGRTFWNPRLSSGILVTPCRALSPPASQSPLLVSESHFRHSLHYPLSDATEIALLRSLSDTISILAHSEHSRATPPLLSCPAHPPVAL
jgi:hypothetical protein